MVATVTEAQIDALAEILEERERATKEGVKNFVEPAAGTLVRVKSKRDHFIFGRRGTGKTSLLTKANVDLRGEGHITAEINLGDFSTHTYPDLIISVLITLFEGLQLCVYEYYQKAKKEHVEKTGFWSKLFKRNDNPRLKRIEYMIEEIKAIENELRGVLYAEDGATIKATTVAESAASGISRVGVGIETDVVNIEATEATSKTRKDTKGLEEAYKRNKIDYLKRKTIEYSAIIKKVYNNAAKDTYIFLDDLYRINWEDQPRLLEYIHNLTYRKNAWLKIGTIKYRSNWYQDGKPPLGLRLGDDAQEINLDTTLNDFSATKNFLRKVLLGFLNEVSIPKLDTIMTDGAFERLVLASGGVARDAIGILRRGLGVEREKQKGTLPFRLDAESINTAAGEYVDSVKSQDFNNDGTADLTHVFDSIKDFCIRKNKANCFLFDMAATKLKADIIAALADLRVIHLARVRETVSKQPGQVFQAYMLDIGFYTGIRKIKGLDMIEFWKTEQKEKLRRSSYIFDI